MPKAVQALLLSLVQWHLFDRPFYKINPSTPNADAVPERESYASTHDMTIQGSAHTEHRD